MWLGFFAWLLAFFLQAALLGLTMYGLIVISDLESDYVNPHDSSSTLNKLWKPEYLLEGALTILLWVSRYWLQGLIHLPLVAWNLRTFLRDHQTVDVTEIFRQIHWEKKVRIVKLIMYLCLFVFVIYRLVESAVVGLLSEENKKQAGMLLQDAATATYY